MKHILPKGMVPGTVIENAVQHDPQSGFMQGPYQLTKVILITQKRVDLGIIYRIITMIGGALKDRVQIDPLYAKVFQVGYFPGNSFQRSAEEIVSRWSKHHRVSFSCEAVGEDLIPYEVLCPVRRTVVLPFEHIGNHKGTQLRLRQYVRNPQLGKHELCPVAQGDPKMIAELMRLHGDRDGIEGIVQQYLFCDKLCFFQNRLFLFPLCKPEWVAVEDCYFKHRLVAAQTQRTVFSLYELPRITGSVLYFIIKKPHRLSF